jgi:hypothetical protein
MLSLFFGGSRLGARLGNDGESSDDESLAGGVAWHDKNKNADSNLTGSGAARGAGHGVREHPD